MAQSWPGLLEFHLLGLTLSCIKIIKKKAKSRKGMKLKNSRRLIYKNHINIKTTFIKYFSFANKIIEIRKFLNSYMLISLINIYEIIDDTIYIFNNMYLFKSLFLPRVTEFNYMKETIKECVFCWNYTFYLL